MILCYSDTIWIYISLRTDCLVETLIYSMLYRAFIIQGHELSTVPTIITPDTLFNKVSLLIKKTKHTDDICNEIDHVIK